jgi:hypothetical protein
VILLGDSEMCAALFDTPDGTGVCEKFGPHERHGGVLTVGVFRCHHCRHVINPRDEFRETPCRCRGRAA